MRVLWFTNMALHTPNSNDYNGGGWIQALFDEICLVENIEIGICYFSTNDTVKFEDKIAVYSIKRASSLSYKIGQLIHSAEKNSKKQEEIVMPRIQKIVSDFKPDLIHVFGSENIYGLIGAKKYCNVPVVLHIQGIISPYYQTFLPNFISWRKYIFSSHSIRGIISNYAEKKVWEKGCVTEQRIFKSINHYMGRTEWDKSITHLLNPKARYYNVWEILRDEFYSEKVERNIPDRPVFISVISWQLYKGHDVILRTAKVLKECGFTDFEWRVYGNLSQEFIERITQINYSDVNVKVMGVVNARELRDALLNATAYIHPSYIENSSNAICEAQILGCTCIATNVGGTSTLISHGETGYLVPANDPYTLAYQMIHINEHKENNIKIGLKSRHIALKRHDKSKIVNDCISVYKTILNES